MNPIILAVVGVLAPFIGGFLSTEVAKFNGTINNLPAPFPQLIGVVVAYGLAALAQFIGISLPGELAGVNQDVIAAILTALAQMLFPISTTLKLSRVAKGLKA